MLTAHWFSRVLFQEAQRVEDLSIRTIEARRAVAEAEAQSERVRFVHDEVVEAFRQSRLGNDLSRCLGAIERAEAAIRRALEVGDIMAWPGSLEAAMTELVDKYRLVGLDPILIWADMRDGLPAERKNFVLSVVNEALQNVSKHSDDRRPTVEIELNPSRCNVRVSSSTLKTQTSRPVNDAITGRTGLTNIASGARRLGGTCASGLDDSSRFVVDLWLPTGA